MSGEWADWIGRSETRNDVIDAGALARFKATLNMEVNTSIVPDGFHWCLGLPDTSTDNLGIDGHPPLGGFMPPLPFPRRMWAASDVAFLAPLKAGAPVSRQSSIERVEPKSGKSGDMVFVMLAHETRSGATLHIRETQTIVYRDHPDDATPLPEVTDNLDLGDWDWRETVTPTAPLLFRYSALMFNTHRIHYDAAYATQEELYPALVVHGPLTASLLLKLCADNLGHNQLKHFNYRAKAPLFVDQPLYLRGRKLGGEITLCAFGGDGRPAVEASATR